MKFAEDLEVGSTTQCAEFSLTREEIMDFARRYDPQHFHLDDDAASQSLFGQLTASGMQCASATRKLVLHSALGDRRFLGSPGAKRMLMHKPVYPGTVLRVTHTIKGVHRLSDWPGVALVEGLTLASDTSGEMVQTIEDLSWIGSRSLPADFDPAPLVESERASAPLGMLHQGLATETITTRPSGDEHIYWDDCPLGAMFSSDEFAVSSAEVEGFHAQFDPVPSPSGALSHPNDWHVPCLTTGIIAAAFWCRTGIVGGSGIDFVRWQRAVQAGDVLRGQLVITQSRPLRTRQGVGFLQGRNILVNQRGQAVSSFFTNAFVRMRSAR